MITDPREALRPQMEKGVIVKQKPSHDAFDWYVLNDSGALEEAANWPLWDEWRHTPGNKLKYVQVLDLVQLVRKVGPPGAVTGEELVRDAVQEDGGGSRPH